MLFSLSRTDEETLNNGVWIHFYFFFANASQVHHQMLKATFSWRHLVMDLCHYHPFHQTTSTQRKYDSVHRKCVGWLEVVDRCWRVHCFTRLFQLSARIKKVGWVGITFHVEFDRAARAARHPSGPPAMRGLVSRRVYDIDLHLGQTLTSRKENMHVISCWDTDLMPLGETGDFPSQNLPPKCRTITMRGLPPPLSEVRNDDSNNGQKRKEERYYTGIFISQHNFCVKSL